MSEADKSSGWMETVRRSGDALLGLAQTRLELLSVEWQEEKLRALRLLLWFGVALMLLAAGLLVMIATLALWFWALAGYWGLVGLALLVLAGAAGILLWLRRELSVGPRPFTATVAEFQKDREWLRKKL